MQLKLFRLIALLEANDNHVIHHFQYDFVLFFHPKILENHCGFHLHLQTNYCLWHSKLLVIECDGLYQKVQTPYQQFLPAPLPKYSIYLLKIFW